MVRLKWKDMSVAMMALMISCLISCTEFLMFESCNCDIGWLVSQLHQSLELSLGPIFLMDMTSACIAGMCDTLKCGCVSQLFIVKKD